jgi:hypothetical protein
MSCSIGTLLGVRFRGGFQDPYNLFSFELHDGQHVQCVDFDGWLGRKHSDGRPVVGYDVIPFSLQQLQNVHIPAIQRK